MPRRVRRGGAVLEEERPVRVQAQRHELRREPHAGALDSLGEGVVRREARHQHDLDAEAREVCELEVEERQVVPRQDRRQRLHLGAEARRHAAGEHDGGDLAASDDLASERGCPPPLGGAGCGQRLRHVFCRHLDRLADAVHRLEVVAGFDHAGAQLLEGDALEVKALEQRGEVRWDRPARDLHHGSP